MYTIQNELYHHGVKGQKWGVRRYQYADGTLTPTGRRRLGIGESNNTQSIAKQTVNKLIKKQTYLLAGKEFTDSYLAKGTQFSRIQSAANFENFAFYATYKNDDAKKYLGLFGKNITARANAEARAAEKKASKTNDDYDLSEAKRLRERSDNMKVYQLKLEATKKLKTPSDENASDITNKLLKDKQFKDDLTESIAYAKTQMRRPAQQQLLTQAQKALKAADARSLTEIEKLNTYKALNLTLTYHDRAALGVQDKFYGEMKRKGYNALLDYNDAVYSSYKAKRPMIVFDTNSVKVSAILEPSPKVVDTLHKKYNAQRMRREIPNTARTFVTSRFNTLTNACVSYVNRRTDDYLER